jgi:hypothetical protein
MGQDSDQNFRQIGHVLFIDLLGYSELLIVAATWPMRLSGHTRPMASLSHWLSAGFGETRLLVE